MTLERLVEVMGYSDMHKCRGISDASMFNEIDKGFSFERQTVVLHRSVVEMNV